MIALIISNYTMLSINLIQSVNKLQENVACRPKNYRKVGTLAGEEDAYLNYSKLSWIERKNKRIKVVWN